MRVSFVTGYDFWRGGALSGIANNWSRRDFRLGLQHTDQEPP
jgi:hypothetical protein